MPQGDKSKYTDKQKRQAEHIEEGYKSGRFKAPRKPGIVYMLSPHNYVFDPGRKQIIHFPGHLMFYAPYIINEDIGAVPDLSVHSSLLYPFIDKQGNAEQSYVIQLIGEAEKAKILVDEEALLDELCAYRDILCLVDIKH